MQHDYDSASMSARPAALSIVGPYRYSGFRRQRCKVGLGGHSAGRGSSHTIKGVVGKTTSKSEAYLNTARYTRRQQRASTRSVPIPPLLGPFTDILAALAAGPLRRINLETRFHELRIAGVAKRDVAGLMTSWRLPYLQVKRASGVGRGKAQRGYALALNPAFPLALPVRCLIRRIAKVYALAVDGDISPSEAALIASNERVEVYRLFGSRVRTKMLIALYCLQGRARSSTLYHAVPNESPFSVKGVVAACIRSGILVKSNGEVRFADTTWSKELRALLRAFVKYDPSLTATVHASAKVQAERVSRHHEYGLFGKRGTERVLNALAALGPQSLSRLHAHAQAARVELIVERFRRMGLVTRSSVESGRRIALNAAHPIYEPLRTYLIERQGLSVADIPNRGLLKEHSKFSVNKLFATTPRLNVLIMLHLAGDEGIDGADLLRLLPQHNRPAMLQKVWDFCSQEHRHRGRYGRRGDPIPPQSCLSAIPGFKVAAQSNCGHASAP